MKVLFVCWANVGRSQMAEAFYNQLTGTKDAESAGTAAEYPGETLEERRIRQGNVFTIQAMAEEGIDVKDYVQKQLTEESLANYDLVVSMAQPEYTPVWLRAAPNFVYWEVEDPGGTSADKTTAARDIIKEKVTELVSTASTRSE